MESTEFLVVGCGPAGGTAAREAAPGGVSAVVLVAYRLREEGNRLYGGLPRSTIGADAVMVGGTAAALVDATTGEGV